MISKASIKNLPHNLLSPFHLSFIPCPGPTPLHLIQAENLLQAALNDLESRGVLQHSNRMDISELLNPAAESHDIFSASDKDIHDAVMEAKRAREQSMLSGNDDDDPEPVEPEITRKETLAAAISLRKYAQNLNNSLARQLEVV
ncbi:hypothetical protein L210DRAFT_3523052 [Boletus edulis BED1]|uniref:Uncharacterized protein n=1 Tax=Boletus edulis BED1 TaxID=1328754 RepID=A0AAD4GJC3_BOLED|nr:hypothetical protein L210DRAFT_3523052 [Boletus edulis BED1]